MNHCSLNKRNILRGRNLTSNFLSNSVGKCWFEDRVITTKQPNFEKGYDKGHSREIPKPRVLKPPTR